MFLFPLRPGVERTREQIIEGGKTTLPRPRTGRGQSFVLRFLGPPFPSSVPPCQLCMRRWICLALSVLPFAVFAAANTPTPHTEAALPSCPPNFKFVRLPTQAGAQTQHRHLLTLHRKQATTHSCSARRCVPRPASYGVLGSCGRPIILLLPLCVAVRGGKSRLFAGAVPSHNTIQPTTN